MKNKNPQVMRLLLPVSACLITTALAGCNSPAQDGSPAAPVTQVSATEQSQVEQAAQSYVADMQTSNDTKAEAMMSPAFRAATPPRRLKALLKGPDRPFLGAKDFQFDPAQPMSHGAYVALRARFVGGDGEPYRTSFLLTPSGAGWQVSGLFSPATHHGGGIKQEHPA